MFNSLKKNQDALLNKISELENQEKKYKNRIGELDDIKTVKESEVEELRNTLNNLEKSIKESQDFINQLDEMIKRREKLIVDSELKYIDYSLTGIEFEQYASKLLTENGYICTVTKASGDGGVDIIATKENNKYAIQCKLYSNPVGNKAVQEVYTAQGLNKCDFAIVLTNNFYTNQAIQEATELNVQLWDRNMLTQLLYNSFNFAIEHIDVINNNNNNNMQPKNKLIYEYEKNEKDEEDEEDPLLIEAIDFCIEINQVSTSLIQRHIKVGYARAGRIIDQMEEKGIISGFEGSKPRKLLISKKQWEEIKSKRFN